MFNQMTQIKAPASWRRWIEVELRLKRKWNDGTESLIFSQRAIKFTVVERLAGVIPPLIFWPGLTSLDFTAFLLRITYGETLWCRAHKKAPTRKRTCPAFDEPNDSGPPPTVEASKSGAPAEYCWRGLSYFAKPWVWIRKFVCTAQE